MNSVRGLLSGHVAAARRTALGTLCNRQLPGSLLAAAAVASIVVLAVTTSAGGPPIVEHGLQILLLSSFTALAIIDVRTATAIALVELVVGGAGGRWTEFPAGLSGRIVLDSIVTGAAAVLLARDWRREGRTVLGRYGLHALAIAALVPGIWMTLGLVNGWRASDVFADGNGAIFFAFILIIIALARRGEGEWLRHWIFVACALNALLIAALILVSAPGWVSLRPTLDEILLRKLDMGGIVGYMPNGAYRLYLGSGIFLQVGLALTAWRLLVRPRTISLWLLFAVLTIDVAATYTRGFWLGAALAVLLVLALGARDWRTPAVVAAATCAVLLVATGLGRLGGFSVPDYLWARASSIVATRAGDDLRSQLDEDLAGAQSNEIRRVQARVLLDEIEERPLVGHGFGAIARDYPYAQTYAYELSYLHLLFKIGVVGTLLFLSFHMRIVWDAVRVRTGRLPSPDDVSPREAGVVVAIVGSLLLTGASNPYILAAFGILPILACVAWLDPGRGGRTNQTAAAGAAEVRSG